MYLFIDTETTDLPARRFAHYTDHDVWTRVVSISWALFQAKDQPLKHSYHIVQPDGFLIPEDATKIHGITTEHALAHGLPLAQVLQQIAADVQVQKPSLTVAHNIAFDWPVLLCEMSRVGLETAIKHLPTFCTMIASTEFCALPHATGGGVKWPRLHELHTKLFGVGFTGQHDAAQDVLACARCYFRLVDIGLANAAQAPGGDSCCRRVLESEVGQSVSPLELNELLMTIRVFAYDHPDFDARFSQSVERQFRQRGFLYPKQVQALKNIISGWHMDGYRRPVKNTYTHAHK
jgi:DNA polymerase III epsilon subunit-like protein